jgi:hypothetical protein
VRTTVVPSGKVAFTSTVHGGDAVAGRSSATPNTPATPTSAPPISTRPVPAGDSAQPAIHARSPKRSPTSRPPSNVRCGAVRTMRAAPTLGPTPLPANETSTRLAVGTSARAGDGKTSRSALASRPATGSALDSVASSTSGARAQPFAASSSSAARVTGAAPSRTEPSSSAIGRSSVSSTVPETAEGVASPSTALATFRWVSRSKTSRPSSETTSRRSPETWTLPVATAGAQSWTPVAVPSRSGSSSSTSVRDVATFPTQKPPVTASPSRIRSSAKARGTSAS